MKTIMVRDLVTKKIYSNDMSCDSSIIEIHFCTSYSQVRVQEKQYDGTYKTFDIIIPPIGTKPNWVDLIATQNDHDGEWLTDN